MRSYNEMVKAEEEFKRETDKMLISSYKETMKYIQKVINLAFMDNSANIASYLSQIPSKKMLIEWCVREIHYDGVAITTCDGQTIELDSFKAHDAYYDPILPLDSNDERILEFFNKEFENFLEIFKPGYSEEMSEEITNFETIKDKTVMNKIINRFNQCLFNYFEIDFRSFQIYSFKEFAESNYSLKLSNERMEQLEKEIYECYKALNAKRETIKQQFDDIVKELR